MFLQGQLSLEENLFARLSPQDISLLMGQTASQPSAERWGSAPSGFQNPMANSLPNQGGIPPVDTLELLKAISQVGSSARSCANPCSCADRRATWQKHGTHESDQFAGNPLSLAFMCSVQSLNLVKEKGTKAAFVMNPQEAFVF